MLNTMHFSIVHNVKLLIVVMMPPATPMGAGPKLSGSDSVSAGLMEIWQLIKKDVYDILKNHELTKNKTK